MAAEDLRSLLAAPTAAAESEPAPPSLRDMLGQGSQFDGVANRIADQIAGLQAPSVDPWAAFGRGLIDTGGDGSFGNALARAASAGSLASDQNRQQRAGFEFQRAQLGLSLEQARARETRDRINSMIQAQQVALQQQQMGPPPILPGGKVNPEYTQWYNARAQAAAATAGAEANARAAAEARYREAKTTTIMGPNGPTLATEASVIKNQTPLYRESQRVPSKAIIGPDGQPVLAPDDERIWGQRPAPTSPTTAVNVNNAGETALAKNQGEGISNNFTKSLAPAANEAAKAISVAEQIAGLADVSVTGTLADQREYLLRLGQTLGVPVDANRLANTTQLRANLMNVVLGKIKDLKPASNSDRDAVAAAVANTAMTPDQMRRIARMYARENIAAIGEYNKGYDDLLNELGPKGVLTYSKKNLGVLDPKHPLHWLVSEDGSLPDVTPVTPGLAAPSQSGAPAALPQGFQLDPRFTRPRDAPAQPEQGGQRGGLLDALRNFGNYE